MILLPLALQLSCGGAPPREPYEWPPVTAGAPMAGAAEAALYLPIGSPMGGYSSRCGYLGSSSKQDKRDSAYTVNWDESTGVQTRPQLKALWLYNGDDHLVILKADVIYSFDGMVADLSERLSEAVGVDLSGKVVITANHSHSSYSNFSDQLHFYLGGDRYNEENYQRMTAQLLDVALAAYEDLQPAAIGASWTEDWDPEDTIYRDRRGENDALVIWPDQEDHVGGKDPYVYTLRVDTVGGEPIAALFTFGVHGTILGEDSSMISSDAAGHLELGLEAQFDSPVVVMHLQGAGGDASPGGRDVDYARLESIGEYGAALLMDIWEQTPTSAEPIELETASRHIDEGLEAVRVRRDGAVDWYYPPYDEDAVADESIYEADGTTISSPLDEFKAPYGAAFCGADEALLPVGDIGAEVYPYGTCVDVEMVSAVLLGIFDLDEEDIALPMPSSLKAGTTASRIGALLTRGPDGSEAAEDLLVGFFPAEITSMFTEQWRRRARDELGYDMALAVGYAQDHEGYFLLPEDWLLGGYEPNINLWGPLQAEHVMEGVLDYAGLVLSTDVHEPEDPLGWWGPTEYPDRELERHTPDSTPDAGTVLSSAPDYFWLPLGWTRDVTRDEPIEGGLVLETPATVARVQGAVQLAWEGGDPAVDAPRVVLERLEGGAWTEVTDAAGRPITEAMPDILLAHTPDPLYPYEDEQVHRWWAGWQAVSHFADRAGLPLGTYRLAVSGRRYTGGEVWPFESAPYTVEGPAFELVPAAISIEAGDGGWWAWIQAPAEGWRLVDMDGDSRGANPLSGPVEVTWSIAGADPLTEEVEAETSEGRSWLELSPPAGATGLRISDAYGNAGEIAI